MQDYNDINEEIIKIRNSGAFGEFANAVAQSSKTPDVPSEGDRLIVVEGPPGSNDEFHYRGGIPANNMYVISPGSYGDNKIYSSKIILQKETSLSAPEKNISDRAVNVSIKDRLKKKARRKIAAVSRRKNR